MANRFDENFRENIQGIGGAVDRFIPQVPQFVKEETPLIKSATALKEQTTQIAKPIVEAGIKGAQFAKEAILEPGTKFVKPLLEKTKLAPIAPLVGLGIDIAAPVPGAGKAQKAEKAVEEVFKITKRGVKITNQFVDYTKKLEDLGKFDYKSTSLLDPLRAVEKLDRGENGLLKQVLLRPIQEADDNLVKEATQLQKRVSEFAGGIKSGDEADQLIRKYGERNVYPKQFTKEDAAKVTPQIQRASDEFRKIYDELLERINVARTKAGQKLVPKRKDYFTHAEELGVLTSIFGDIEKIPGDMLRAAPFTRPNAAFLKYALPRKFSETTAGAIEGFERYMQAALPAIHYTDPILNLRGHIEFLPPRASAYFNDLANKLAGKKSAADRPIPEPLLKIGSLFRRMTSKGLVLGNFGTAFLQPSSIASTIARTGLTNTLKAIPETFSNTGIELAEKYSKVLRARTFDPDINPNTLNKVENIMGWGVSTLDRIMVRNAFLAGLKKSLADGVPFEEAVKRADDIAQKTQASNRKIFQPPLLQSEAGGTLGQLQTFTINLYNQIRRDLPVIAKDRGKLEAIKAALYLGVSAVALNKLYEEAGLPQPYNLTSFVPFAGTAKYGEPTPALTGLLGAGQVAFGEGKTREAGLERLKKFGVSLIPGGRQAQKTLQGLEAIQEGGSKTPTGRVRFPVRGTAEELRALLFGPSQTKAGQKFYNKDKNQNKKSGNRFN